MDTLRKKLFCESVRMMVRMNENFEELYKLGFELERGPLKKLGHDIDNSRAALNAALGLKECERTTTLDWWWDNRESEDRGLKTLIFNGAVREEVFVDTPEDLWDVMVKMGEIEND